MSASVSWGGRGAERGLLIGDRGSKSGLYGTAGLGRRNGGSLSIMAGSLYGNGEL